MQDNFDDVPLADAETHAGWRSLLEDRQAGIRRLADELGVVTIDVRMSTMDPIDLRGLPIVHSAPHIDVAAQVLAQHPPVCVMLGKPGLGKSYHDHKAHRAAMEELNSYELQFNPFRHADYADCRAVEDDRNLPEWQKRRNASATAKQALINKMKGKK